MGVKMIPRIIHYCWFGKGEMPKKMVECICSWKEKCPDYKIVEWNEENFDVCSNLYVQQAYKLKKYAFVTDYVRLYVLYHYGGIYMDTDVEVLKPLDRFLVHHAFSGFEDSGLVPTGIMGSEKRNEWIKTLLDEYNSLSFVNEKGDMDFTTNVYRITNISVKKYGLKKKSSYQELKNGTVVFYPYDFFCPKSWKTGEMNITNNTYSIHHFSGSWMTDEDIKRKQLCQGYIQKFGKIMGILFFRVVYYSRHPKDFMKKIKKYVLR